MPFTITHESPNATIHSTGLVKCDNCGNKDILKEDFSVGYVGEKLHETLDDHEPCSICEETDWSLRAELVKIGLPEITDPETVNYRDISGYLKNLDEFEGKLRLAQSEGFNVHHLDVSQRGIMVLWKSL